MERQLTTEQILLLENLMYLSTQEPIIGITDTNSRTIEDWMNEINISRLQENQDYGSYMTGREWKNILTAVKNDPELLSMEIVNTYVDHSANGGGGGVSAAFRNPDTKEAVVAFRGTASEEWKDNFIGGGSTGTSDSVSTQQQQNALEWYQSLDKNDIAFITVTGHSKGGNKAKYITIMDDTVDRCISFDGQGFSDEFIDTYENKIAQNQGKITNHNIDYDYVNILLNDVGERIYYEGYDYGKGGFLENHCPNTFFDFGEDGNFSLKRVDQGWEMQEMDQFLNSCLRSLPVEKRTELLSFIGEIAEMGLGGDFDINELFQLFCTGNNTDSASYLLAYLIEYEQSNPAFSDAINSVMNQFGMQEALDFIKIIEDVINSKDFDRFFDIANFVTDHIPGFVISWLSDWLQKKGINLTEEQIRQLLGVLSKVNTYMDDILVEKNGKDKTVKSEIVDKGNVKLCVRTRALYQCKVDMEGYAKTMKILSEEISGINRSLREMKSYFKVKRNLAIMEERLKKLSQKSMKMGNVVEEIADHYVKTEERIVSTASVKD